MKFIPSIAGEYRGAFGGLVASRNKGGQYIRRRAVPTNPATDPQEVVRAAMSQLVQRWNNDLDEGERDGWRNYAVQTGWSDKLGQSIELQGVNEFVRSNVPRIQSGQWATGHSAITAIAPVDDAPTVFNRGQTPVIEQPATLTDGVFAVTLTGLDITGADRIFLYVSRPLNPSRIYWKGPYLLVAVQPGGVPTVLTQDLNDPDVSPWPTFAGGIVVGQAVHLYVRVALADGRLSDRVLQGPIVNLAAGP